MLVTARPVPNLATRISLAEDSSPRPDCSEDRAALSHNYLEVGTTINAPWQSEGHLRGAR